MRLLSFALVSALVIGAVSVPLTDSALNTEFGEWARKFNKNYDSTEAKAKALAAFSVHLANIQSHNAFFAAGKATYSLGLNQYSDMTKAEIQEKILGFRSPNGNPANMACHFATSPFNYSAVTPAPSVDWRTEGKVTMVKNQCGSCWAFSTVGAIEGAAAIANGFNWTSNSSGYSEMELVTCDPTDMGCQGGLMDHAFLYVQKNGGIDTEKDWPYMQEAGCDQARETLNKAAGIETFGDVPVNNVTALKQAVTMQPVSVAIDASCDGFMNYKSGVLSDSCGTQLDHGVLLVGYGTQDGKDYWIVKNSWGDSWGENGFIRMAVDVGGDEGNCGILQCAAYPTALKKSFPPLEPEVSCDANDQFSCPKTSSCCCSHRTLFKKTCTEYTCCLSDTKCNDPKGCQAATRHF